MKNKYNLQRPIQRIVRFNDEENKYLSRRIDASPFTNFQNFARILLLTGEVKIVDYSELWRLNGEVNRVGNNINQMAKLAHQFDEISTEDVNELTQTLKELKELVAQTLKKELKTERTF